MLSIAARSSGTCTAYRFHESTTPAEVTLLAGLFLWRTLLWAGHVTFLPFDVLGWAGSTVLGVLGALHTNTQHLGVEVVFVLGVALKAAAEATIDCGLAAAAWWVYGLFTRETTAQRWIERFGICMLFLRINHSVLNRDFSARIRR